MLLRFGRIFDVDFGQQMGRKSSEVTTVNTDDVISGCILGQRSANILANPDSPKIILSSSKLGLVVY